MDVDRLAVIKISPGAEFFESPQGQCSDIYFINPTIVEFGPTPSGTGTSVPP